MDHLKGNIEALKLSLSDEEIEANLAAAKMIGRPLGVKMKSTLAQASDRCRTKCFGCPVNTVVISHFNN
jgi:hypothetical protein